MANARISSDDFDQITLTITVPPIVRLRIWLGLLVIKFGVRIIGMRVQINEARDE